MNLTQRVQLSIVTQLLSFRRLLLITPISHHNHYDSDLAITMLLLLLSHFSPTLCDPVGGSPLGSSVHGISQARVLERGAIAFSEPSP